MQNIIAQLSSIFQLNKLLYLVEHMQNAIALLSNIAQCNSLLCQVAYMQNSIALLSSIAQLNSYSKTCMQNTIPSACIIMSLCLLVCLSVCFSVYLSACLSVYLSAIYGTDQLKSALQSKPKKPTKSLPAEEKEVFVFIFNVYTITLITALVQIYIVQSLRLSTGQSTY